MRIIYKIFPLLLLWLIACSNDQEGVDPGKVLGVDMPAPVEIIYYDEFGNNLLDNKGTQSINVDNVKIYYLIDDKWLGAGETKLMYEKGFKVAETLAGKSCLDVSINLYGNSDKEVTLTLIDFGGENTDTLKTELIRANGSSWLMRIWYNDIEYQRDKPIEVVK